MAQVCRWHICHPKERSQTKLPWTHSLCWSGNTVYSGRQQGGGCHPFRDTIVKPEVDGRLSVTVYRKATQTDQYLEWDSHHHLSSKYSVINALTHRTEQFAINLSFSKKK